MARKKTTRFKLDRSRPVEERAQQMLRLLGLTYAAQALPYVIRIAEQNNLSHIQFLNILLEEEIKKREESRIKRWIEEAGFPCYKTLSQYDFSFPKRINEQEI